jgi:hypothetical protein
LYLSLILDDESTRGGRACQPVKSLLVHNNVTHENCNRYKPGTGSLRGGFISMFSRDHRFKNLFIRFSNLHCYLLVFTM